MFTKDPVQFNQKITATSIPIGWGVRKISTVLRVLLLFIQGKFNWNYFHVPDGRILKHVKYGLLDYRIMGWQYSTI